MNSPAHYPENATSTESLPCHIGEPSISLGKVSSKAGGGLSGLGVSIPHYGSSVAIRRDRR